MRIARFAKGNTSTRTSAQMVEQPAHAMMDTNSPKKQQQTFR
jgi:hypothetical protein